eukprot:TRINITY_DN58329_c0_g1_i1.p1 TRINITY_DN58329_c0_g1~~TRINITY_DN58329_c0_g1_i1.p1  ORF type:complete len:196 (-),score=37.70 TRINITY_DN58329_c0_g1_i1:38-625(-)
MAQSSKISAVRKWDKQSKRGAGTEYVKPLDETFRSVASEVMELGSQQFFGHEKKAYEAQRLQALGAKVPKSPKVPIRLMEKMSKSLQKKNQKLKDQCQMSGAKYEPQSMLGAFMGTQAETRLKHKQAASRVRESGLRTGLGRFKDGVLTLRKSELSALGKGGGKGSSVNFHGKAGSKKGGGKGKSKKAGGKKFKR